MESYRVPSHTEDNQTAPDPVSLREKSNNVLYILIKMKWMWKDLRAEDNLDMYFSAFIHAEV